MSAQCNTCLFWKEDMRDRDPNDPYWGFGHCRREPPKLIECMMKPLLPKLEYGQFADLDLSTVDAFTASKFPATFSTDWCGKHRPAQEIAA